MPSTLPPTIWAQHRLEWGQQTHVMGILNVTPDSFSGDGLSLEGEPSEADIARAVVQAEHFVAEGATIIDIGGESTRPGAKAVVTLEQELARVIPVIRALVHTLPAQIIISIDTYHAAVAAQALEAGASMVNDIWALRADAEMASVVQKSGVPVVLMANMAFQHPQSGPENVESSVRPTKASQSQGYQERDIVSDVIRFLAVSIEKALVAGIAWEKLIIDPGIGFGTTPEENLTLLRHLNALKVLGRPILLGTSRKSTIGRVLGGLPANERVEGTAATVALGIAQGADIVRVHDVHEMVRVVKMSDAIIRGSYTLS